MKNSEKKKRLFGLFSQNLKWFLEDPKVTIKGEFTKARVFCPICFRFFFESDLFESKYPLTLEDVPPKSLGGNVRALTCKDCNSQSGHLLDGHLYNRLNHLDFISFKPNSGTRAKFNIDDRIVNGRIDIDEKGTINMKAIAKSSDPKMGEAFESAFEMGNDFDLRFTVSNKFSDRRSEIAILRIAYLTLYSTFGNGFLAIPDLDYVRQQLINPDADILPKVFWIKQIIGNELEGINLIIDPPELRCFLVVITLKTKSSIFKYNIAIPAPISPGIKIYENLEKYTCGEGVQTKLKIEPVPDDKYLTNKELVFECLNLWNGL